MSGPPQPDLNKVISSKCQTFIKQFIASTNPQREYEFFGSAKIRGTRAYEIVTKIKSIQDVAIDNNIDINQKKSQIQKAIIEIEKNINDNLRLYVSNNDRANAERFISDLKNLNLDIDAALIPNSTINLRGLVQQQTVPKPVSSAVSAATPIKPTNDALQKLEVSKQEVDKLSRELTLLRSQLEEKQTQNTQLDADKQQLSDKNSSLLTEIKTLNRSLEAEITANKVLSTTLATTESEKLVLSNENKALKKQLSEIQTNQSDNNDTISQLQGAISTLKAEALVSGKQSLEKEEMSRLKLEHEQEIARLNLQHEGETSLLKAKLEALKEPLNTQSEKLEITTKKNKILQAQSEEYKETIAALTARLARSSEKNAGLETILAKTQQEMEAARTSVTTSSDESIKLNKIQQELKEKNADLEAKIAVLQQQISDQKPQTIPEDDQKSTIEALTKANAALTEQLAQSQAQHRSEIEAVRNSASASSDDIITLKQSQQELTEKNTVLQAQSDGLAEENAVLWSKSKDQQEEVGLLKIESNTHLENAVGRLSEIQKLEESQQELTAENAALQAKLDGLTEKNAVLQATSNDQQERVGLLKIESNTHLENAMGRLSEIQKLEEQISAMKVAEQLATELSATKNSTIIKLEESQQELTAENVDLKTQLDGLTEKNAVLQAKSNDQQEGVGLLKIESKTHLENAMARLREIQELKEQISNMEAAKKLATASSDNMANMADRIRELEQREQRLAVEKIPFYKNN